MSTSAPLKLISQVGQRASASSIASEAHVIGEDDANTVWLNEMPDSTASVTVSGTPPGGAGSYTEVGTTPSASGEFLVNDTVGSRLAQSIQFHSSDNGGSVTVSYDGLGGTVLARDFNRTRAYLNAVGTLPWGADPTGSDDARSALNAAITEAAADGGELIITGTYKVSSNLTFPSTVRLRFMNGGRLDPDSGVTLTYECEILAPDRMEIFGGAGTHDLADARVSYVPVTWFDDADLGAKTNSAITAVGGTTINRRHILQFPRGKTTYSTSINADATSQLIFRGWGRMQTHLEVAGSLTIIGLSLVTSDECEVRDLRMTEASGSIVSTLIQMTGTSCRISDCFIGNASVGIHLGDGTAAGAIGEFDHCIVESCKNNWLIEGNTRNCTFTSCFGNAGNAVATTDAEWLLRDAGGQSPSFLTFQGCKAEQGSGHGWLVEEGRHLRWMGCQVRDMDLGGIYWTGGGGHGSIMGCDFEDNAVGTASYAIEFDVERVKVVGNTFRDNGTTMSGIHVNTNATLWDIHSNTYRSLAGASNVVVDATTPNGAENGVIERDISGAAPTASAYQTGSLFYDPNGGTPKLWVRRPEDAGFDEVTLS